MDVFILEIDDLIESVHCKQTRWKISEFCWCCLKSLSIIKQNNVENNTIYGLSGRRLPFRAIGRMCVPLEAVGVLRSFDALPVMEFGEHVQPEQPNDDRIETSATHVHKHCIEWRISLFAFLPTKPHRKILFEFLNDQKTLLKVRSSDEYSIYYAVIFELSHRIFFKQLFFRWFKLRTSAIHIEDGANSGLVPRVVHSW